MTWRIFETDAVPDTTGATEMAGAGCAATAAAVDTYHFATEDPVAFVAVTATVMNRVASAVTRV